MYTVAMDDTLEDIDLQFPDPLPANPAVEKKLALPPAVLDAIMEDPTALQPMNRVKHAILVDELFRRRQHLTPVQQMQLADQLEKWGNPKSGQNQASTEKFSVNIILSDPSKTVTIEQPK